MGGEGEEYSVSMDTITHETKRTISSGEVSIHEMQFKLIGMLCCLHFFRQNHVALV